jgi:O-antigen/teichoic acid export membrane protein
MYKELLKNFLKLSIGNWINIVVALLTTPIITRMFLPEEYGKFSMYNLAMNLLLLISLLGTDQSFMRFYTSENRSTLVKKCLNITLSMFGIISLITIVFRKYFSNVLFDKYDNTLIILILVGLLIQIILKFLQTDIRMRQDAILFSSINVLTKVSNVVITIAIAKIYGNNYYSLILAYVISSLIVVITIFVIDRNKLSLAESHSKIRYKDIFNYGIPYMSSLLVFWLFQSFDKIALKYLSNYLEVGVYVATMKLVMIFNIIQNSFMNFWTPVSFEYYRKEDNSHIFFNNMFLSVGFFLLILGNVVIMFSDLTAFILGQSYKQSTNVLPFLIFVPILYTVSEITVIGINFLKRTGYHLFIATVACFVNIGLNYLIIPLFGAKGAAFATAIGYIVFFILRTYISTKLYDVGYEVSKFYFGLTVLFAYAMYATFNTFSIIHILLGVISTILIIFTYRNYITKLLLKLRSSTGWR